MSEFRPRALHLFCLSVSLAFFFGCSGSSPTQSTDFGTGASEFSSDDNPQPSKQYFSEISYPPPVRLSNWNDYLETLSEEDRSYLTHVSMKYYGALIYSDPSELATLSRLGFPPLDEWIKAKGKTDSELLADAQKGGVARAFYTERILEIFEQLQTETGKTMPVDLFSKFPEGQKDELTRSLVDAQTQAAVFLRENPSPFSAYVYGRISAMATGSDIPVLSSLALADDLGDTRAEYYLMNYSKAAGPVNGYSLLHNYRATQSVAQK